MTEISETIRKLGKEYDKLKERKERCIETESSPLCFLDVDIGAKYLDEKARSLIDTLQGAHNEEMMILGRLSSEFGKREEFPDLTNAIERIKDDELKRTSNRVTAIQRIRDKISEEFKE
jgi:hypothetical protein